MFDVLPLFVQMRLASGLARVSLFAAAASLAAILGTAGMLAPPGTVQADEPDIAPTPAATGVTPVVSTVVPRSDVVTPERAMAERTVSSATAGEADSSGSSHPFSGVRGGLIGAGIGVGAFVVVAALVAAARAVLRRVRP
jgi:hypothetical protein